MRDVTKNNALSVDLEDYIQINGLNKKLIWGLILYYIIHLLLMS